MDDINITKEIHDLIQEKIESGVLVSAHWLATGIIGMKDNISGEDAPFYRVCAYRDIVRIAKRVIGKYEPDASTPEQLVFPGFKHLCKAYPMQRDDEVVLVPVNLCTSAELLARADQLGAMAVGCQAHAREIRAFVLALYEETA